MTTEPCQVPGEGGDWDRHTQALAGTPEQKLVGARRGMGGGCWGGRCCWAGYWSHRAVPPRGSLVPTLSSLAAMAFSTAQPLPSLTPSHCRVGSGVGA